MKLNIVLIFFSLLIGGEGLASVEKVIDPRLENVKKVSDDFFVGEGYSADGKKIYFGMQRITNSNRQDLLNYIALTKVFFDSDMGVISRTAKMCALGMREKLSYSTQREGFKQKFGGSQQAFDDFIAKLCNRPQEDMRKLADKISQLSMGSSHIHDEVGDFIAFISMKPIEQPLRWNLDKANASIQQYLAANPNLIVFVGTQMEIKEKSDTFDNRGVQKTFKAILEADYKGVSFPLHGFTAAVAKKYFGKKYFQVRANVFMASLLRQKLFSQDYTEFESGYEQGFTIPVDVLIDFYSGKRK